MQDRTINNALLSLAKQGGSQGKIAEALLHMRSVEWSGWYQIRPNKRGDTKRLIIGALSKGPRTNAQLGRIMQSSRPDLTQKNAANRTYQALLRLEEQRIVCREAGPDGCLWRL